MKQESVGNETNYVFITIDKIKENPQLDCCGTVMNIIEH